MMQFPMSIGMIRFTVDPARFLSESAYWVSSCADISVEIGNSNCKRSLHTFSERESAQSCLFSAALVTIAVPIATACPWDTVKFDPASTP